MNADRLTEQDLARYREKALVAKKALDDHMQTAPSAPHGQGTHTQWRSWIATAQRLGKVALDCRIAFIRTKRQFEHEESNQKW